MLVMVGCVDKPQYPQFRTSTVLDCNPVRDKLVLFVSDCVKSGNNMADEEMEDVIKQCEMTGKRTVCPEVEKKWKIPCAGCEWIPVTN